MNNLSLFEDKNKINVPLAEKSRPVTWQSYQWPVGINDTLKNILIRSQGVPPSLILWGPPGSGKTTLARLIGLNFN